LKPAEFPPHRAMAIKRDAAAFRAYKSRDRPMPRGRGMDSSPERNPDVPPEREWSARRIRPGKRQGAPEIPPIPRPAGFDRPAACS